MTKFELHRDAVIAAAIQWYRQTCSLMKSDPSHWNWEVLSDEERKLFREVDRYFTDTTPKERYQARRAGLAGSK